MQRHAMAMVVAAVVVLGLALAGDVRAQGVLIPKDEKLPPLAIKHQRVDVRIQDGTATATIEQVFKNSVDRDLEAVYVFPLPRDAAIADFALYINGERQSGELVEKDKARQIYQDIVRRMRDPGLLEHLGGNLFRVSVFPVPRNGEQKIELTYSQTLPFEGGLYHYVYPLKTSEKASRTLEDFSVRVRLQSALPIRALYSPSHKVGISRKGDHEAVLGFEEDAAVLDRDFELYYGVSKKDFGMNLLTHAVKGGDGFFLMMLAPSVEPPKDQVVRRDIAFVLDTSGSMSGEKMEQARAALLHCIGRLQEGDRFSVIRFSTDAEALADVLLEVNDANREKARAFVRGFEARGGTAIADALALALSLPREGGRPYVVAFLTDGRPTIGESDIEKILAGTAAAIDKRTRIFPFGVGDDVNTHLLDRLAGAHGGAPQYVRPSEDIEVKVSAFYDRISHPVLATPVVSIERVKTRSVHPQALPDLFAGSQLLVLGRYAGAGDTAIRLKGDVNGVEREFVYEATFSAEQAANAFIPRLWATRRVGYLLDQIRLQGEEKELKDEVVALSREYGILTPYTSYLVLEKDADYAQHGIPRGEAAGRMGAGGKAGGGAEAPMDASDMWERAAVKATRPMPATRVEGGRDSVSGAALPSAPAPLESAVPLFDGESDMLRFAGEDRRGYRSAESTRAREYLRRDVGTKAVDASTTIARYRDAEGAADAGARTLRHVAARTFARVGEVWVDTAVREDMERVRVAYAGKEYFALLDANPELKDVFALGVRVAVVVDGKVYEVVEPETP